MELYGQPRIYYPHPYRVVMAPEHLRFARPVLAYPRCTCECYCDPNLPRQMADYREEMGEGEGGKDDVFFAEKSGRRNRTTYKRWQIEELESAFSINPYPTSLHKKALAVRLGLRDSRVQVWFQNRRAKSKRNRSGCQSSTYRGQNEGDYFSPTASDYSPKNSEYHTNTSDCFGEARECYEELSTYDCQDHGKMKTTGSDKEDD
ncbi:visual system homeobox 1 [Nematostella vectensis]|uniref:visual system homeobox 1 n=1 Tax=Nematostella vectensis TaxID=45351 RepID=UPI00207724EB|nr:visual system homeobox 1 [Nematostella vectensis]